jgi:Domain of unknown function (DUF4919)
MNRLIICVFIFVAACAVALGQKPVATPEAKPKYEELLAKVQGGDTKIDYRALRMAYSETKEASPFGSDREARSAMNKALDEKRYKDAIKSAEQILKTTYVNPFAHMTKAIAHRELGETDKFEFHKAIYLGLINSILNRADGKTPSTAYVVISTEEEYAVMQALGYGVGGQSLQHTDGHTFDVLHGTDKSGNKVDVYFNIDIVWAMENRMFNPKE